MDGQRDDEGERNVIRFPRDWVGPPEDLVPVGSRARALEEEERRARGEHDPDDEVAGAGDFWGEGASALHHPIAASASPPRPPRHRFGRPSLPRVAFRLGEIRRSVVAGGLVVVGLLVAALVIGFGDGPSHHVAKATRESSVAGTAAAAIVPAAQRRIADSVISRELSTPGRTRTRKSATRHGRARVRSPHTERRTSHTTPPVRPVVTETVTTSTAAPIAAPSATATTPPATSAGYGGSTGTSSTRSSEPTHASSSGPAGPSGAGSAVGCDPKCK